MAHAGPSEPAQPPRKQHSRLQRALRRYFALLAALMVVVLVGAGCSVTRSAEAQGRNDGRRHQRPTATTADPDDGDDNGDDDGDDDGDDQTGTTADPTATTADPTGTTADPTGTTADPTATTADPTATTADPTQTTADPNVTTTTADPNAALPFSTTECDPAGLPEATGQQTDEIGGPVCNTGIFGVITGPDDIPTVKITSPANGDTFSLAAMLDANNPELIPCEIEFNNFQGGTFDGTGKNGQARQFGLRPFSVNANGDAIGHSHCYLRDDEAGPTDQLQSFLALNQANQGNTLAGEMPPLANDQASLGEKKMCVDLAGGNHMTWNKGVAQRFPATDCITITIEP